MVRRAAQDARDRDPSSPLDVAPARSRVPLIGGSIGAAVVHGLLLAAAVGASSLPARELKAPPQPVTELIQVEAPPPEPEPPPPEPEPETPPPPPAAPAPPTPKAPKSVPKAKAPEEAAPAAAEAAKVMEAPEPEVVDFGNTFVQGNAAQFAGGVTESGGTSKQAVRDPNARAYGVPGGTGTGAPDRSREPMLAEGTRWDCPFPEEADDEGIDDAVVTLRVSIASNGAVNAVDVAQDPGNGFGREAKRCAQRKRWQSGLDRGGNPITATRTLRVRFER